jgi:hypothetical protein
MIELEMGYKKKNLLIYGIKTEGDHRGTMA